MGDVVIETIGLARSFERGGRRVEALAPATCRIRVGDRVALMGPSGSGKSTLLHLMAGLDRQSAGEIRWPTLGAAETLRPGKVAVVFQAPSLMPPLNVVENVELPLILAGSADDVRTTAMKALDQIGLADLAEKLPEELSGGQAMRVAMARAMAARPRLLLADEPTGQLDQATGRALIDGLFAWLAESRTALVLATHDPAVAGRMDQIWRMEHGRLCSPVGGAR
jgi:putative ABC transport system ATP-binding protein/lipoprotein-releasing system ATP-binding protein